MLKIIRTKKFLGFLVLVFICIFASAGIASAKTVNILGAGADTAYFVGNVGIGTSTVTSKLTIQGSTGTLLDLVGSGGAKIAELSTGWNHFNYGIGIGTSNSDGFLQIMHPDQNTPQLYLEDYGFQGWTFNATNIGLLISSNVSGTDTNRVTINGSGYLGVGTTNPQAALQTTSLLATGGVTFSLLGGGGSRSMVVVDNSGTLSSQAMPSFPSGTDGQTLRYSSLGGGWVASSLLFNNGSSIGIGTTAPGAKLDVVGNSDATQLIVRANSTQDDDNPLIKFKNSSGGDLMWITSNSNTNMAIGYQAKTLNQSSSVALGTGAMKNVTGGGSNTAVGFGALNLDNPPGATMTGVTAIGYNAAGLAFSASPYLTAVGFNACMSTGGSYSVCLGASTVASGGGVSLGYQAYTGNSAVAIGYQASAATNKLTIDTNGGTALISGDFSTNRVAIATSTGSKALSVGGDVQAYNYTYWSDRNMKKNIKPLTDSLAKILKLQGVSFEWKNNPDSPGAQIGLIAQDVEKVFPELVQGTDVKSVSYGSLVAPLTEAIKEQQKKIDELEARIKILELKK